MATAVATQIVRRPAGERVPELDGLRGIAILLVLIFHFGFYYPSTGLDRFLGSIIGLGTNGVDLFFVLSGFLITGILIRTKDSPKYFHKFYARRILRIFPLYYLFLAGFFLFHRSGIEWPYWLYISNWRLTAYGLGYASLAHLWSLSVEEQFYLAWPLIVYISPRRWLPWICVSAAVSALVLRIPFAANPPTPWFLNSVTFFRLDGLALGALIATGAIPLWVEKNGMRIASVALGFALVLNLGLGSNTVHRMIGEWDATERVLFPSVIAFGFAALLLAIVQKGSLGGLLRAPGLRSCGKYSYAIYILHHPISVMAQQYFVADSLLRLLIREVLGIAVSYAMGWLSWVLLEQHILKLKRHFEY